MFLISFVCYHDKRQWFWLNIIWGTNTHYQTSTKENKIRWSRISKWETVMARNKQCTHSRLTYTFHKLCNQWFDTNTTKHIYGSRIQAKTSYASGVRYFSESTTGPMKLSYFWICDNSCRQTITSQYQHENCHHTFYFFLLKLLHTIQIYVLSHICWSLFVEFG